MQRPIIDAEFEPAGQSEEPLRLRPQRLRDEAPVWHKPVPTLDDSLARTTAALIWIAVLGGFTLIVGLIARAAVRWIWPA